MRTERIFLRIDPVVDERFDGVPYEAVDQDQARQALISHLIKQVVNSSKTQELMQELFLEEGRNVTPISHHSKKIIKEQRNIEAFELLELTNNLSRLLLLRTYSCVSQRESRQ